MSGGFFGISTKYGQMTDSELLADMKAHLAQLAGHIDDEDEDNDTLITMGGVIEFARYLKCLCHYGDLDKLYRLLERLSEDLKDD